ncbi:MAG: retroviral-like aspartic protease family protein [Oscillospiraceae bacterium]|nr:retroviral-like aspartic protease family protein [Oscillospiraceae bacterium]
MDVFFGNNDFYELQRENGLLYVSLQLLYHGSPKEGEKIRFVLDTGAFLTVISRGTAIRYGFDKLPKEETVLFSFGGVIKVDFVRLPGLIVLGKIITDVPVLIPHTMYREDTETGERKQMPEVLGLNILEYYNYYIDTENELLYLKNNPNPKFYSKSLSSGQIFTLHA